MAKAKKSSAKSVAAKPRAFCSLREMPERQFKPEVNPNRAQLIRTNAKKWVNGTMLRYCFHKRPAAWATTAAELDVVRRAFKAWKDVGIGLDFKEVDAPEDAEVRIGFLRDDGAWSYIGRDVLGFGPDERTMNFGWDLTRPGEIDTAIHEIGHTLGFPHEHQNPFAGIVWDEEAVYAALAAPPNRWSRQTTFQNIIAKISPDTVQGSQWDPDSVMHYPFEAGLIKEPAKYHNGLFPAGGISARDREWVKTFYPTLKKNDYVTLELMKSTPMNIAAGQQMNFVIAPAATRNYEIGTFGKSDTVMVLFEDVKGDLKYLAGDDDSGEDTNARIRLKLMKGRRYVLRIRLYYAARKGETAVMYW